MSKWSIGLLDFPACANEPAHLRSKIYHAESKNINNDNSNTKKAAPSLRWLLNLRLCVTLSKRISYGMCFQFGFGMRNSI